MPYGQVYLPNPPDTRLPVAPTGEPVEAHPRTLKYVFRSDVRLEVPLFQRRYVWNEAEQWEPLWEDVLATLDRMNGEDWVPQPRRLPH